MLQVGKGSNSAERSDAECAPAWIDAWFSVEGQGRASLDPDLRGEETCIMESKLNGSES